ncbi:hypothetical protein R3P38DRAFT_3253852 [Favolaschia claudopus]|uniref:Uncharacterized protein n=1 Tax=Favolaschia claudopus TaxID=2862362 RepID=A0AAW0DXT6_9AGAR
MRSFAVAVTLATAAFAAPAAVSRDLLGGLLGTVGGVVNAAVGTIEGTVVNTVATVNGVVPLPTIINQVMSDLGPVTAALSSIVEANATQAVIQPLTEELTAVLTSAVSQLSDLAGKPLAEVLATADGVIDATGAAQLLAPVFTTVYGATQQVLSLVESGPLAADLVPLLNGALGALDPVLTTVAPVVNGLFVALAPLVGPVVNTLNGVGLGPVVQLLGSIL